MLHNGVSIEFPDSVKFQLIETVSCAERLSGKVFTEDSGFFHFLFSTYKKKSNTEKVTVAFKKTYELLDIPEMLAQAIGGKKDRYLYPPESYKKLLRHLYMTLNRSDIFCGITSPKK